jgi:hypothetical protein
MKIESRIKRLEEQQPKAVQPWRFILLIAGETRQEGLARWRDENSDKLVSSKTVYFKIVDDKQQVQSYPNDLAQMR